MRRSTQSKAFPETSTSKTKLPRTDLPGNNPETARATNHRLIKIEGKTTMRVMIAAAIVAFGPTTTAHAGLRYYIDQDVLRKNEASTLLHRAMQDIGRNPTGWSHRWCGRQIPGASP